MNQQGMKIMATMGDENFDAEHYFSSPTWQAMEPMRELLSLYREDEGCEEVLRYWENLGLKKELHETEQRITKWASYLPMAYIRGEDEGKKYPLLFVLHGSTNPIFLAETYGYTHLAAKEQLIVIMPEDERPEKIDALYQYAIDHYPVDRERVYMVGYSFGGYMTSIHTLRHPERYAGAGVGGMLFAWKADAFDELGTLYPAVEMTESELDNAARLRMPVCHFAGEHEMIHLLPYCTGPEDTGAIKMRGSAKINSLNNWRRVAGCPEIPMEQVLERVRSTGNIVTKKLGFPFEETRVETHEDRSYYIGDCINAAGENLARFVGIEGAPHWPTSMLSRMTWDFISQYKRDVKTGLLIKIESS